MKFKLRMASVVLLAMAAAPAWALQFGQIQVKSALNQPLVAAIPLHPENLTELDGLTVGLATADDFARAGLQRTPTDRTLRFHVVTDNNGQKLILVTSSQPITDPYLDFLVQVNTRQGKQLREFVVLLNPVIASPAPAVQSAPVAGAPSAPPPAQPAQLPTQSEFPQPVVQPEPQPQPETHAPPQPQATPEPRVAPPPPPPAAAGVSAGQQIPVHHGDTLYGIAQDARQGTGATINQLMLALKSANPEAFFKDNINDLKAGAILRIPTRDEIDKVSIAEANAEVHRQYEAWRAAKPHRATVIEGTAAQAAARTAPQPGPSAPASDHLALVPPTGGAGGAGNRPGVAGGTGSETLAGLQRQLQNDRATLTSLNQSNTDLESRVHSLEGIADKSGKLLNLKDTTIAELQHKLAAVQPGTPATAAASSAATPTAAANVVAPASGASTGAGAKTANNPAAGKAQASATPWFQRPLTWIVAGLIVLGLILIGLLGWLRRGAETAVAGRGPLSDPEDVSPPAAGAPGYEASLRAQLKEDPDNLDTHLALCRMYYAHGDTASFLTAAEAMHVHVSDAGSMEWHEVAVMGEELAPGDPLFAAPAESQPSAPSEDPYGLASLRQPADEGVTTVRAHAASDPQTTETGAIPAEMPADPEHTPPTMDVPPAPMQPEPDLVGVDDAEPDFSDDPVDTKLDLARAYMDMGDPVGARAMLDEVLEEGSQTQKDEAKRLLAETSS
ncbi:MAG TPA: FimV/HubP family polar landmark protein [Rhodanobacteraceae bacterium]|nr:FimV/HubP family polar landmark protein [Rhodanobacteraceae bacterium]